MKSTVQSLLSTLNIQPNNPIYTQVTGAYVSPLTFINGMNYPPWQMDGPSVSDWFQYAANYNSGQQRSYFVESVCNN